jgi:hypothetical protein
MLQNICLYIVEIVDYGSKEFIIMAIVTDKEIGRFIEERKTLQTPLNPSFRDGRSSQKFEQEVEGGLL